MKTPWASKIQGHFTREISHGLSCMCIFLPATLIETKVFKTSDAALVALRYLHRVVVSGYVIVSKLQADKAHTSSFDELDRPD